jgi:hypothetical protein
MVFDALIIGGGVSGLQCALVLGSAKTNHLQQIKALVLLRTKEHHTFKMHCLIMF